ncbi:MAG: glycosyltransferase family 9 protein [Blastochloris sp.]|nr:glycosyltransferase family 9 protein [Blastochloris sp.]
MKVLVVKPTALGDVAQALLLAPHLKRLAAEVELIWLVDEDYQALVRACPAVDRIILFPRRRWKKAGTASREIASWLRELREEEVDVVLDLQGLARSGIMTWMSGARRRVGLESAREFSRFAYTELVPDAAEHAVDRYARAVAQVLGSGEALAPCYLSAESQNLSPSWGLIKGAYTVLHPYSIWGTKLWPWQRYEELARALPEEKFVVVGRGPFFPSWRTMCWI